MSANVAIFIRGFERTWDWVKNHNFHLFESIYGSNIDWYVATWHTTSTDCNKLLDDFDDKNLRAFYVLNDDQYPLNDDIRSHKSLDVYKNWKNKLDNYWRLAYLDYVLGYEKTKYELNNNLTYDVVVFTRFDLLHYSDNIEAEKNLKLPRFFITENIDAIEDMDNSLRCDVYYKSDSITADLITSRFFDPHINDFRRQGVSLSAEVLFSSYLSRNGIIGIKGIDAKFGSYIVRPNECQNGKLIVSNIEHNLSSSIWQEYTITQKINECVKNHIDPFEYVF